jgi:hypothetical protein
MQHVGNFMLPHDALNFAFVPQVDFFKGVLRIVGDIGHIGLMTGVGQAIEVNEAVNRGLLQKITNRV